MKHFINQREHFVGEAIDGVLMTDASLVRLDGYPAIKVVYRADFDRTKVAIVSGGGAGHEPAHVGFVGRGMLTGAISGDVFASPSVEAVLAGIVAVTGDAGCLLIVKSYTGDRLNFGLAAERARALGIRVEMVIVSDDIAIAAAPHPRGIAGTLFVHKIAGHLAEEGASLSAVKQAAERVARSVKSLGIALTSCSLPGQKTDARIAEDEAELGLGIHGEPGALKIPIADARDLVKTMLAHYGDALTRSNERFAVLINALGGVPEIEMSVVTEAILTSSIGDRIDWVVGPAPLMTSLDMKGFSLSFLPLDAEIERGLVAEVGPSHWPRAKRRVLSKRAPLPKTLEKSAFHGSRDDQRREMILGACRALVHAQAELDALDAKVGDGDTGSTLATAARAIEADVDALPLADAPSLFSALSDRLASVMGGSSGVLLSIFMQAIGSALASGASFAEALAAGARRMQEVGGAKEGDRTMLDALLPAIRVLESGGVLAKAATAARDGAEKTRQMTRARAGRSSYLREDSLRDVPDPGAIAVAHVLAAIDAARAH